MGIQYSYELTSGRVLEELLVGAGGQRLVLCDLQFEDEHSHALAPLHNALVVLEDGVPDFCRYPEDFLDDGASDAEWAQVLELCNEYDAPSYGFYDEAAAGKVLEGA